jgi:hypothetical protein
MGSVVVFITTFINLTIGVLSGVFILVVSLSLATLAGEFIAKFISYPHGEREGLMTILQTTLTTPFVLFVLGLAAATMFGATDLLTTTNALPVVLEWE